MKRIFCRRAIGCGFAAVLASVPCSVPNATAAGLKKIVAVSRFENKSGDTSQTALGDNMADQLSDALVQSGEFIVVEPKTLDMSRTSRSSAPAGKRLPPKPRKPEN